MQRRCTAEFPSLDVREWVRLGALDELGRFTWGHLDEDGTLGFEIDVDYDGETAVIEYSASVGDGPVRRIVDVIDLERQPQHFGSTRVWFNCPECQRRVAILYINAPAQCRQCLNLSYPSQKERPRRRAERRARKVRLKLGGESSGPLPEKPKHILWSTYERLKARHDRAVLEADRSAV